MVAFSLLLLHLWGLSQIYGDYRSIVNNSENFHLAKMKLARINGAGPKGGRPIGLGYVIGRKSKCLDCKSDTLSETSVCLGRGGGHRYDSKYENVQWGDTIPVWYSPTLDRAELVFPNGINGLIEFEKQDFIRQLKTASKISTFFFFFYFLSRGLRKYYQKKMLQSQTGKPLN